MNKSKKNLFFFYNSESTNTRTYKTNDHMSNGYSVLKLFYLEPFLNGKLIVLRLNFDRGTSQRMLMGIILNLFVCIKLTV